MVVSSDLIRKYSFKFTVKDERVFCVFFSGLSRFSGWKFEVVWSGGQRPSSVNNSVTRTLSEKCANTEFFLDQMRENTDQKKLRLWTLFTQW